MKRLSALKLIDLSSTREPTMPWMFATKYKNMDPQAVGCSKLCEMLKVEQRVGQETQLFADPEGTMTVPHSSLADFSELHKSVLDAPELFTYDVNTLTLWYRMPAADAIPPVPAPKPNSKQPQVPQKRKQQVGDADKDTSKKINVQQDKQTASSTDLPSGVTAEMYRLAHDVMPR